MRHLSYKTKFANKETHKAEWFVVDATNQTVGRLCAKLATVLRGKHKPTYTPHADAGDFVVVINADKVVFTGDKMNQKIYLDFSGYPGGQKQTTAKVLLSALLKVCFLKTSWAVQCIRNYMFMQVIHILMVLKNQLN
jgi:large subunit ribosomal protein L13